MEQNQRKSGAEQLLLPVGKLLLDLPESQKQQNRPSVRRGLAQFPLTSSQCQVVGPPLESNREFPRLEDPGEAQGKPNHIGTQIGRQWNRSGNPDLDSCLAATETAGERPGNGSFGKTAQ